jgi:zinc protease
VTPLAFPDDEFRKHAPEPAAPRPFKLPPVHAFTLDSGIAVYLVEQHTLPTVSMQLELDGGGLVDPRSSIGLASIAMAMMTEGTDKLDKLAYAEALADVASSITASATEDSFLLAVASLSRHLDVTMQLFVDTLRAPGLRAPDLERMLRRRIESVRQSRGAPQAIPGRVMGPILYGPEHPFGAVLTESALASITLDDVRGVVQRLAPRGARLFVVGDLTEEAIRRQFSFAWDGAPSPPPAIPHAQPMAGRIFFVEAAGATQAQVLLLHAGPARTSPHYFANMLLAGVFGGGFTSRLNMNLREDKGYCYGARGGFSYTRSGGTFVAMAQVRGDAAAQALLEIDREVRDLASARRPVTAEELEREKQGAILALPGRFATPQAALGQYRALVYFGLPLDSYASYTENVAAVTRDDVDRAATRELSPERGVYLVVGDGSLRAPLAEIAARGDVGDGGFVELDADGRELPQ